MKLGSESPDRAPTDRTRRARWGSAVLAAGLIAESAFWQGCGTSGNGARAGPTDGGAEAVSDDVTGGGDSGQSPGDAQVVGDVPSDVPATAASACGAYAHAFCAYYLRCDPVDFTLLYADAPDCEQREAAVCPNELSAPGTSLTAGGLVDCADAYTTTSCETFVPAACLKPGTLSNGGGCEYDSQCQSTYCNRPAASWCGTCTPRSALGAACSQEPNSCELGMACALVGCSVGVPDGGGCPSKDLQSICVTPVADGGSCLIRAQCATGLACISDTCAPARQPGEPCSSNECALDKNVECAQGDGGVACLPVSYAPAGQACDPSTNMLCSGGGRCVGPGAAQQTGVCQAAADFGQACGPAAPCLRPYLCIGSTCQGPVSAASCP